MAEVRDWIEVCPQRLGAGPGDIAVDLLAGEIPAAGGLAFARPERIALHPSLLSDRAWRDGDLGRRVVAHEVAHVVQYRRGRAGGASSTQRLEAEADAAADAILAGRPFACREARIDPAPLYWNRFGHYYTVFFLATAVGFDNRFAQQVALNCQLPDMVSELDAVTQSIIAIANWRYRDKPPFEREKLVRAYIGGFPLGLANKDPGVIPETPAGCLYVNRGLHCLTGNNCKTEQFDRLRRLESLSAVPLSVDFGLALHAYGDSFAHTPDSKTMFDQIEGHSLDIRYQSGDWGMNSWHNKGHAADNTNDNYDQKYARYMRGLYEVFKRIQGRDTAKTMLFENTLSTTGYDVVSTLGAIAQNVANDSTEQVQIRMVKAEISKIYRRNGWGFVNIYDPPYECVSYANLVKCVACNAKLPDMLKTARAWAGEKDIDAALAKWAGRMDYGYNPERTKAIQARERQMTDAIRRNIYAPDQN